MSVSVATPTSSLPNTDCHISAFPCELLSAIFEALAHVPFHPFRFQQYRQSAFRDVMSASQVNSLFRSVAIRTPQIWTEFPCLNINPPSFVQVIVKRSYPLPFCLSYVETERAAPPSSWGFAMTNASRLKGLCLEVPEGVPGEGPVARSILSLSASRIERCIVVFRGLRNVRLFTPSDSLTTPAPHLKSLHLLNCHIPPQCKFLVPGQITSAGITHVGRNAVPNITWSIPGLIDCPKWTSHFATLKHLILWNCFPAPLLPSHAGVLKLPLLKSLAIGTFFSHAVSIAQCLELPSECLRTINLFFLNQVSTSDAQIAAGSVVPFLTTNEEFDDCQLNFDALVPSLRCSRPNTHIYFLFHLFRSKEEAAMVISSSQHFTGSPLPKDLWTATLWEALGEQLRRHLKNVRSIKVAFPPSNPSGPFILPSVLPFMPNIHSLSLESPVAYTEHPTAMGELSFTQLEKVVIYLADGVWEGGLKASIASFVHGQVAAGNPVRELLFVVSPALGEALGYARADGVRLILGELVDMIPSIVRIEWTEG